MYLSLPRVEATDPLLTLQVHSGGIVLCCDQHAVVEHLTHNPSPYEVAVATWYHLIEKHGRVVDSRIPADQHPLRKHGSVPTEQPKPKPTVAGHFDRLTGRPHGVHPTRGPGRRGAPVRPHPRCRRGRAQPRRGAVA